MENLNRRGGEASRLFKISSVPLRFNRKPVS